VDCVQNRRKFAVFFPEKQDHCDIFQLAYNKSAAELKHEPSDCAMWGDYFLFPLLELIFGILL